MTQVITKSAKRVMEIFERFDQLRRPLSLKDVCDDLGYPISSAAALLKSLVNIGYLEYDKQHRNYLPTMKIAMLGSWVPEELFGRTSILPIMNQVRDFSGESVCLGTRSDLYAQYVHVVHSEAPLRYLVPPGAIRPLARSGFGLL
ncbi:MAG: helix-turn-helix domain-containing protein, partial [Pseudomonadota bacterium]